MHDARLPKLRVGGSVMTAAVLASLLSACTPLAIGDYQSLRAGSRAAAACQERFHDGAPDFAECVRFVSMHPAVAASDADLWALGALQYGWLMSDVAAQSGLPDADAESRRLVAEAEPLRSRLKVAASALCRLVEIPCRLQLKRRSERLAGR